jgi:hypothetical protein
MKGRASVWRKQKERARQKELLDTPDSCDTITRVTSKIQSRQFDLFCQQTYLLEWTEIDVVLR